MNYSAAGAWDGASVPRNNIRLASQNTQSVFQQLEDSANTISNFLREEKLSILSATNLISNSVNFWAQDQSRASKSLSRNLQTATKSIDFPTHPQHGVNPMADAESARFGAMSRLQMFAKGGYVNKPTLGLIGEAGDNEYVIPERRMAASAMAFLSGARGMDVINPPRFANGGVVGSSVSNRSGNLNALLERTGAIGGQTVVVQEPQINATIQVSTGDVLQFEGQQYVTLSDYQRGLKQVQSETLGLLRTAQGRRATGR